MSEQCRAYTFDRHERAVTLRGLQEMRRIFVRRSEPEGVAQCDAAIASLSHPVPTAQDMYNEVMRLRAEVARLQALWDAVEKIDNWRDSHLLDEIYISTGSKWHAGGDSALLGKGNGALEMLWRGLWEPRSDDDVTIESPSLREVIIALAAKLDEETPNATD